MVQMQRSDADQLNLAGAVQLVLPKGNVVLKLGDFFFFIHTYNLV